MTNLYYVLEANVLNWLKRRRHERHLRRLRKARFVRSPGSYGFQDYTPSSAGRPHHSARRNGTQAVPR